MGLLSILFGSKSNLKSKESPTNNTEKAIIEPIQFETDWKNYRVHAKYKVTNRFRTEDICAKNIEHCHTLAKERGLLPPYKIIELPSLPTENQITYAKKLGIRISPDITFNEISDLICRKVDNGGGTPQIGLVEYAISHGMHFSRYIGKNTLYDLIFKELNEIDKIAFFIFCVYRWMSDDREANLDKHRYKKKFYEWANQFITDDKLVKSMNRYNGSQIKFFGTLTINNREYYGGSTETIAFKKVSKCLENELKIKTIRSKQLS